MPYKADSMQKTFPVGAPEAFGGMYTYDPAKEWSSRSGHDPWTWWHQVEGEKYPHFTAWFTDFSGNPLELKTFHITYPYLGQKFKAVHIHYEISNGGVVRGAIDFGRVGGDKLAASEQFYTMEETYKALAQSFIDRAFD